MAKPITAEEKEDYEPRAGIKNADHGLQRFIQIFASFLVEVFL
jgi:hypothetical protein